MKRSRLLAGLVLLLAFGGGLLLLERSGATTAVGLETSDSCRACHADVYSEWETSFHAQSFTDPLVLAKGQSNNFRQEECIPCHAPAPVFEHGIGKLERVVERVTAREQGVDCLSCHRAHDRVIGPATLAPTSKNAPCRPLGQAELASPALCAPCHNQHNTVDQWEESSFAKSGVTCGDCHMQPVARKNSDGTTRQGRSHRFLGAHDPETLGKAFTLRTETKTAEGGGKVLVISVTNSGAGHNFPADARHRALDLVVTLIQPDGVELPPRDVPRPYARERGTARRRFRNPYREESERITNRDQYGRENTQILAGETMTLEVPYDPNAVDAARIELIYKLTPIQTDDEGVRLHDARLQLSFLLAFLLGACGGEPQGGTASARKADDDPRPFTPWHAREQPLPFPATEWYWQDLLAVAPQPEPLPTDAAAAERLAAAFERVAALTDLQSEEELPAMVADARLDPARLFAALDDPRRQVRYAAARVMLRLMSAKQRPEGCPFPQQLVQAAAKHIRDTADEVALLHLESITRSGFPWIAPFLLKTFGKVDNHWLTVLRVRAAAKLALSGCYGGLKLLIKILKENTSIQDDIGREWDMSLQTAWWKEEAMVAIAALAGSDFGHSPDASDAGQVASVRRIEQWWRENRTRLWSESPPIDDPALIERVKLLILGFGTFQIRNVDNSGFILQGLGPKVAPLLFEALAGSNFMIRRHLLGVLAGLIADVPEAERLKWIERVLPSLQDPDPAIRVRALEVIGASRIPAALPHLERALAPGDVALAETAMRQLAAQRTQAARSVLERAASQLPSGHLLAVPLAAARLAAGDLAPLPEYLQRLAGERGPEPRAQSQMYLSWIVDSDGLADAKTSEARTQAIAQIEQEVRARAAATNGSSQ